MNVHIHNASFIDEHSSPLPDTIPYVLVEYDQNQPNRNEAEVTDDEGTISFEVMMDICGALRSILAPATFHEGHISRYEIEFIRRFPNELRRIPKDTDMLAIRFLLGFDDYFNNQVEYMHHVENIIPVAANNSLYKINIIKPIALFSNKLEFHYKLLESIVNGNMNKVFELLENKKAVGEDIGNLSRQTEHTILSIVEDIHIYLNKFNDQPQYWKNITSGPLDNESFDIQENLVFYHIMAAQMCRYWLELNKRLGYCKNELELEVYRFYKQYLHMQPDTNIFDILPAIKPDEVTAECKKDTNTQKKATATKMGKKESFIINENEEEREETISALTRKLFDEYHLIREEDKRTFKCLLTGGKSEKTIQWPHEQRVLLGLLFQNMRAITTDNRGKRERVQVGERGRIKEEQRLVTTTNGADPWTDVVYQWFVNENGKPYSKEYGKLKDASHAKKWNDTLDDLLSVFNIDERKPISKFR